MDDVLLSVENLTIEIPTADGPVRPLSGVSFDVRRGETFALVGESGCGKSITSQAVMRLLPEEARWIGGRVLFEGVDLLTLPESAMRAVRGGKIAFIFQEPSTALNPVMTAGDQIAEMILAHRAVSRRDARREAVEWLSRVRLPDPEGCAGRFPHELSGGQKQRVMIAMALSAEPALVIADEPTTALDVTTQAEVLALLRTLRRERGLTLLLITHDLAVVSEEADRIALMYAGEIVERSEARVFFRAPLHPYARALLEAPPTRDRTRPLKPIEGSVPTLFDLPEGCRFSPRCRFAQEKCALLHPGGRWTDEAKTHFVQCHFGPGEALFAEETPENPISGRPAPRTVEPLLVVSHLNVAFAGKSSRLRPRWTPVVHDVSFDLRPGETLALVGESGSGKTTTALACLSLLSGRARVTGRAQLAGKTVLPADREALRHLRRTAQIVFQDPFASLDPRMSVEETLTEGMHTLHPEWGADERKRRVLRLLDAVGLPKSAAERLPHAFSGGQRQRIAIARALACEPRMIVCDEPTSALDVSVQAQILNLLTALQKETGIAYLFITHNFAVVEYLADRVVVLRNGRVVESGKTESVFASPRAAYTRALLEAVPRLGP